MKAWASIGRYLLVLTFALHGCADATSDGYQGSFTIDDGAGEGVTSHEADESTSSVVTENVDIAEHLRTLQGLGAELGALDALPRSPQPLIRERTDMRRHVAEYASSRVSDELVRVVLRLEPVPFPEAAYLRQLDPTQRLLLIEERHDQLRELQAEFVAYLESIGAKVEPELAGFNQVRASIPAEAIPEVLARDEVKGVLPSWERAFTLYNLEDARQDTLISEYWGANMVGALGGSVLGTDGSGLRSKIGIIEVAVGGVLFVGLVPNLLYTDHPAWSDTASGPTRVMSHLDCRGSSLPASPFCSNATSNPSGYHGTWVSAIVGADLREGQDPAVTLASEQAARTGMVPEAALYYAGIEFPDEIAVAIFNMVARGVDVINLSLGYRCLPQCDLGANCGGVNDMVRFATDSGVLVVAAAGNSNFICDAQGSPECNVCEPALRPEVVSVGNLFPYPIPPSTTTEIDWTSSTGFVRGPVGGQYSSFFPDGVDVPAVSIVAPGLLELLATTTDGVPSYTTNFIRGTSFAAPIVASAAALTREEMGREGTSFATDAGMLRARLLAMGDGKSPQDVYGVGRGAFRPFEAEQAPKANGHHSFTLNEGESVTFYASGSMSSLPSSASQWRIGINIDIAGTAEFPLVSVVYKDVCGGDRNLLVDSGFPPTLERATRLPDVLFDSDTCIAVTMTGVSVQEGGVRITAYEYYHSG